LPVVSMVVDDAAFFGPGGIYTNFDSSGSGAEVPVSVEFFDPSGGSEFQIDAGVRIHGGNARSHPKKPMRLYFRGEYGARKLRFPLFDGLGVEEFDQLILRGGGHDSWSLADGFGTDSTDLPPHGTLLRDQFLRKTERDLGMLSPAGRYVHVYINSDYWGVYDLHERANADYFSSHLGGESEDWDVMHHPEFGGEDFAVVDGDDAGWTRLITLLQRGVDSDADYEAIGNMLEIDGYIDHLIVRMWSGDYDWCGPIFQGGRAVEVFSNKNWYAGMQGRNGDSGGFRFFNWDAEMSMGLHLMVNRFFPELPPQRVTDFDMTRADDFGSPVFPYSVLKDWPAFQRRFADRLQKHLFAGGVMSVENNRARLAAMEAELDSPMVGESARWGDEGAALLTRDRNWRTEVNWLKNTFMGRRNGILLDQFRAEGLYPDTDAPVFNQLGGEVDPGFQLTMSAADGTIFYTTDGSDPFVPPVLTTTVLIDESSRVAALVPSPVNGGSTLGDSWTAVADPANIGQWKFGANGVGYDYPGEVNVDVGEMEDVNASVFIRIPFTIASQEELDRYDQLLLQLKYEDGFVVYLNGQEVDDDNAPAVLDWDSEATGNRRDALAVVYETFDLSFELGRLRVGTNVLAIHGLNDGVGSSDLLMTAKLEATQGDGTGGV
ncbi:MAG: CotH kinase family protein, partial [Verrucomicrobiales bacterium]|nr:CotH kinase family protein [Verrucomicrobiales bacterium]